MRKFNLSLDDYSPRPGTNDLTWCNKLIEKYPNIKIDLFVPAAYCKLGEEPNFLSKNLEWAGKIKNLPHNYQINLHGLYHRRSKSDFSWHSGPESNNNEWENISYKQASIILEKIENEFTKVGCKYKRIFRPPGWHIGKDAVRFLSDNNILIAGNKKYYSKYKHVEGLRWISYNHDLLCRVPEHGDIISYGHLSQFTNNYFDENKYNLILSILEREDFEFVYLERML